jgi:hypothetical protein
MAIYETKWYVGKSVLLLYKQGFCRFVSFLAEILEVIEKEAYLLFS